VRRPKEVYGQGEGTMENEYGKQNEREIKQKDWNDIKRG
jgi:hypothetical protein